MSKPVLTLYTPNVDAEKSVLFAVLFDDSHLAEIRGLLKPEMFYRDSYRKIFTVMCELNATGVPIDPTTLSNALRFKAEIGPTGRQNWLEMVGGVTAISGLIDGEPTPWNVRHHCEIIAKDYRYREACRIFADVQRRVEEWAEHPDEVLSDAVNQLSRLRLEGGARISEAVGDVADRVMERIDSIRRGDRIPDGLKTGIPTWDRATNGLQPQWFVLVSAPPGMFKTTILLQIAEDASIRQGLTGLFVNFEMTKEELTDRLISQWSGVPFYKIQNPLLMSDAEREKASQARQDLKACGLKLGDGMMRDTDKILAECQRIKAITGRFDYLFVDYIQRMRPVGKARDLREATTEISNGLKDIATEMNCPVIAVSSMNRDGYDDPKLSSLKESGMLEYDANQVIFIKNKVQLNGGFFQLDLDCQKSRNTATFQTRLIVDGERQRFAEAEQEVWQ